MKLSTAIVAATTLFATTALVSAEGVSDKSPGHEMQTKGSVTAAQVRRAMRLANRCRTRAPSKAPPVHQATLQAIRQRAPA
jgi:hypothetical protein